MSYNILLIYFKPLHGHLNPAITARCPALDRYRVLSVCQASGDCTVHKKSEECPRQRPLACIINRSLAVTALACGSRYQAPATLPQAFCPTVSFSLDLYSRERAVSRNHSDASSLLCHLAQLGHQTLAVFVWKLSMESPRQKGYTQIIGGSLPSPCRGQRFLVIALWYSTQRRRQYH